MTSHTPQQKVLLGPAILAVLVLFAGQPFLCMVVRGVLPPWYGRRRFLHSYVERWHGLSCRQGNRTHDPLRIPET